MKFSRVRKLTWRVLLVYALLVAVVAFADRSPRKWRRWNFAAGTGLLAAAVALRLWAAGHLVKNRVLTVTGPYAYVKNPLYIGTFLGLVGFALVAAGDPRDPWWLRNFNWMALGAALLGFVFYYVPRKKRREGERLRELFGEAWDHYDRSVPDYFPRWRRYERAQDRRWSWRAACENSEPWTALAVAAGLAAVIWNHWLLEQASRLLR